MSPSVLNLDVWCKQQTTCHWVVGYPIYCRNVLETWGQTLVTGDPVCLVLGQIGLLWFIYSTTLITAWMLTNCGISLSVISTTIICVTDGGGWERFEWKMMTLLWFYLREGKVRWCLSDDFQTANEDSSVIWLENGVSLGREKSDKAEWAL